MKPDNPMTMHDLPDSERPRERLLQQGVATLSNSDLLAIIIGTGTRGENVMQLAARILAHTGGLSALARITAAELRKIKGLGEARSAEILAAIELGRRIYSHPAEERPIIKTAKDAASLVSDMYYLNQEQVRVMLLDTHRRVIAIPTVYMGTVNMSVIRVAELFKEAILRNSPAVIMIHNHPSGDPAPSPEDVALTRTVIAAGKLLDIQLIDHLIIGQQSWCSLREMGLAFRD